MPLAKNSGQLARRLLLRRRLPVGAIAELAATGGIDVLSISGPEADKLVKQFGFYAIDNIPADTYKGVGAVNAFSPWARSG